jgi:hypothetical protein
LNKGRRREAKRKEEKKERFDLGGVKKLHEIFVVFFIV